MLHIAPRRDIPDLTIFEECWQALGIILQAVVAAITRHMYDNSYYSFNPYITGRRKARGREKGEKRENAGRDIPAMQHARENLRREER